MLVSLSPSCPLSLFFCLLAPFNPPACSPPPTLYLFPPRRRGLYLNSLYLFVLKIELQLSHLICNRLHGVQQLKYQFVSTIENPQEMHEMHIGYKQNAILIR